ncbi:unnamed protein product [Amoebophrya sp. A120]|nr:unnamed protein product [Amoebophrya sp. A120]|eukprot:GSA120T00017046001.1
MKQLQLSTGATTFAANTGFSRTSRNNKNSTLSGEAVSSLLLSFVKSNMPLQTFLRWMQKPLKHLHGNYTSYQLALLWSALAKLKTKNKPLFKLLRKEVKPMIPQMSSKSLIILASSLAKTNNYDRFLMRQISKMCQIRLLDFEAVDLMQLLTAFSELQFREAKFLRMLAVTFLKKMQDQGKDSFPPGMICACVRAYANLRVRHPDWFLTCLSFVNEKENLEKLTEKEAVNLLHALALNLISDQVYVQHLEAHSAQWQVVDKSEGGGSRHYKSGATSDREVDHDSEEGKRRGRHSSSQRTTSRTDVNNLLKNASFVAKNRIQITNENIILINNLLHKAIEHRKKLKYQSIFQLQIFELFFKYLCDEHHYKFDLTFEAKEFLRKARHVQLTVDDYLPNSSKMHRTVSTYLQQVGLPHRSEVQLGPYALDIVIGKQFVLEIDGPSHFFRETNTRLPGSLLKHSLLSVLGFNVRHLAWQTWLQCSSKKRKLLYAASLWREVLKSTGGGEVLRKVRTAPPAGVETMNSKTLSSTSAKAKEEGPFVELPLAIASSADLPACADNAAEGNSDEDDPTDEVVSERKVDGSSSAHFSSSSALQVHDSELQALYDPVAGDEKESGTEDFPAQELATKEKEEDLQLEKVKTTRSDTKLLRPDGMFSPEDVNFLQSPEMTDVLDLVNQQRQSEIGEIILGADSSSRLGDCCTSSGRKRNSDVDEQEKQLSAQLLSLKKGRLFDKAGDYAAKKRLPEATATRLQSVVTDMRILNEDAMEEEIEDPFAGADKIAGRV